MNNSQYAARHPTEQLTPADHYPVLIQQIIFFRVRLIDIVFSFSGM